MKFWILLKKELKEMLTIGTILSMVLGMGLLLVIGNVLSDVMEESGQDAAKITVVDQDQTELSAACLAALEAAGYDVTQKTVEGDDPADYRPDDDAGVLVIPVGFTASIEAGETATLQSYNVFDSVGIISMATSSGPSSAVEVINQALSTMLIGEATGSSSVSFVQNPVTYEEVTFVGNQYAPMDASALMAYAMSQNTLIPIVIFLLVVFASQMIASAIANEKGDKTLETLLCAPISRLTVLSAKMCGAGLVALLMAAAYMVGFSGYMNGMMGGGETGAAIGDALTQLGISLSVTDYLLVGLQLFLTILSALAASLILGALAEDVKQANAMVAPIMICMLVPYMVTLFMDINSMSLPFQILLNLIPFTHTFTAMSNLMFDNYAVFFGGMAYQAVFLVVMMTLAVKLFSGDKVFTMKLTFGKKKNRKAAVTAE